MKRLMAMTLVCGSIALSTPLIAVDPIAISVWPVVTSAGGSTQLRIVLERNAENRALMWEIDGPDYYRSSTKQIDGSASPRNFLFVVKDLPEGEFSVRATVKRADNSQSLAQCTMTVMPGVRHF